jgi:DNA primase
MFKEKIIAKLKALNQDYEVIGKEIKTLCLNPSHKDTNPSFFINTESGASHCFSCGYSINPSKLFDMEDDDVEELLRSAKYNNLLSQYTKYTESQKQEFTLPPEKYRIDRNWRGVSQSLLERLGVYYCAQGRYAGRLVFPILGKDNELQGVDARIVNEDIVPENVKSAKWLRSKGMEAQSIVYPWGILSQFPRDTIKHLVLTEGMMDAVSYLEIGVPAIPTFGMGAPSQKRIELLLELGVETITIGYDNDLKGQEGALRVYPDYRKWFNVKGHWAVALVRKNGFKDANEALVAGVFKGQN